MEDSEEPIVEMDRTSTASPMVVICRICLSTRQHMISIHSAVPEYEQKTLYAMLLSVCLPLNEREAVPGLPEQICRNCKWKLLSAYDLYETTLASDEQLRAHTATIDVRKDGKRKREAQKVVLVAHRGQTLSGKVTASLKRPFSDLAVGIDHQSERLTEKKINLSCVKKEISEECYDESYDSSKINDSTTEERTNQSFPGDDESKEVQVPDPLDAFFEEHYQVEISTGSHVCGLCKQDFAYKSQCRMHILQKHNPAKPFKCDVCFCTLTSQHRLVRHQIVAHGVGQMKEDDAIKSALSSTGELTYTCPICRKVFSSSVRFKRHKNVHVAHNRPFKCEVCLYRFGTKSQLTQHAKLHESKSPSAGSPGPDSSGGWYSCDRCDEMFPGKRARTMHLKKVHQVFRLPTSSAQRSDEREKNDYTCIICQASFARETVLNTHMKMHELLAAEKEKEKRIDLERLVKQELQQQMMLKVPPLPPLSPEVVDKSNHVLEPFVLGLVPVTKTVSGVNNNNNSATSVNNNSDPSTSGVSVHASLTPKQKEQPKSDIAYLCTICEKEFDDRELLKKHQKEAHPKLNVDIVSSKSGSGNDGNVRGRMTKKLVKPFLPRLTAKPGLNLRLLNGSIKQMHELPTDSPLGMEYADDRKSLDNENDNNTMETDDEDASNSARSSPFRCELCNKTFSYKCYLSMHMRKNHDKSKPYGCKVCHYRFGYRGTLLRHQLMHSSQNVRPGGHGSIIFKCRICSAKFLELKQLNIHLKSHRKPTDDPNRKVQLIRCHECTQIFSDRNQFRQHMEDEHDAVAFHQRRLIPEQREPTDSPSQLGISGPGTSSPLADLTLHSELRDEEGESFLDDLSIIKIESNFE